MSTRRKWVLTIAAVAILSASACIASALWANRAPAGDWATPRSTTGAVLRAPTADTYVQDNDLTQIWHPKPWPSPNPAWTPLVDLGVPQTPPGPPTFCNPCP